MHGDRSVSLRWRPFIIPRNRSIFASQTSGNVAWRKKFEQFRIASGLSAEEKERQVNTLLYTDCLGREDAEDVLHAFNAQPAYRRKPRGSATM